MGFRRWGFNFHALSQLYEGPSGTKDFRSSWTLYKANDMFKFFKSDQAEKVISKAGYLKLMTHKGDTFCDPYEAITGNTAHGGGGCTKASIGQDNLIPMQGGFFPTDGRHGAVVATSNEACTDLDGCDAFKETVCEFVRIGSVEESTAERFVNRDDATQIQVDCKGAQGKYLRIRLPGQGERIFAPQAVKIHRAMTAKVTVGRPRSTDAAMPMSCYGVKSRAPPAADDPDVLIQTKLHPMQMVTHTLGRDNVGRWVPLRSSSVCIYICVCGVCRGGGKDWQQCVFLCSVGRGLS